MGFGGAWRAGGGDERHSREGLIVTLVLFKISHREDSCMGKRRV